MGCPKKGEREYFQFPPCEGMDLFCNDPMIIDVLTCMLSLVVVVAENRLTYSNYSLHVLSHLDEESPRWGSMFK